MPGGRTHASASRSYSHAAMRLPRLALIAWWTGVSTCSSTNETPTTSERREERLASLHGADERPHRDGERRRQHAAQGEHGPPGAGERGIGLRQDREQLPRGAGADGVRHGDPGVYAGAPGPWRVGSRLTRDR